MDDLRIEALQDGDGVKDFIYSFGGHRWMKQGMENEEERAGGRLVRNTFFDCSHVCGIMYCSHYQASLFGVRCVFYRTAEPGVCLQMLLETSSLL